MKILFTVEFYEPHKGGVELVTKKLAEGLLAKGHMVTIATTHMPSRTATEINGVKIWSFKISGNSVRGFVGENKEVKRYQDFILGDFDVIINHAAQTWTTDLTFPLLKSIKAKKFFIPCGYSGLQNPLYKNYFAKLPEFLHLYDKLVYASASYQDKKFGDENGAGDKAVVIPNGASTKEFFSPDSYNIREKFGIKTKYLAICVANHYRDKGHGFVIEAFLKMSRQDTTLLIVGENPGANFLGKFKQWVRGCYKNCLISSKLHKNIRLASGKNRELVLSAYKQADIFLFGSKVECAPLVLYEAFASKTLFISTPVGNVPDYADLVRLVKLSGEMAEAANWLLDHDREREVLVQKAFELWKQKYTWEEVTKKYEALIKS